MKTIYIVEYGGIYPAFTNIKKAYEHLMEIVEGTPPSYRACCKSIRENSAVLYTEFNEEYRIIETTLQ